MKPGYLRTPEYQQAAAAAINEQDYEKGGNLTAWYEFGTQVFYKCNELCSSLNVDAFCHLKHLATPTNHRVMNFHCPSFTSGR